MEQQSMTALISAYARWYHAQYDGPKIFDDARAALFLTEEEREGIAASMAQGIFFFNPTFAGTEQEALRWIVDNQLSPSPLGRAAFAEWHMEKAVRLGAKQLLILAAGYDSFAYRQPDWARGLPLFELDHPVTAQDKTRRLRAAGVERPANLYVLPTDFNGDNWMASLRQHPAFDSKALSFCTLLGISYYLSKERFSLMLGSLGNALPTKSSVVFDYPDQDSYTGKAGDRAKKQTQLAAGAGEGMLASYSFGEMEKLLERHGFLAYEHIAPEEITQNWFQAYNCSHPGHPITAFDNVNYCLAVKQ